jgi:hypothetical protein
MVRLEMGFIKEQGQHRRVLAVISRHGEIYAHYLFKGGMQTL